MSKPAPSFGCRSHPESYRARSQRSSVAQMAEHTTVNVRVVGSNLILILRRGRRQGGIARPPSRMTAPSARKRCLIARPIPLPKHAERVHLRTGEYVDVAALVQVAPLDAVRRYSPWVYVPTYDSGLSPAGRNVEPGVHVQVRQPDSIRAVARAIDRFAWQFATQQRQERENLAKGRPRLTCDTGQAEWLLPSSQGAVSQNGGHAW